MDHVDHDLATGMLPTPITILTGFLGAGKTTLLNRILNGSHGLKVAVLVNDFGSINIDAELVVGVDSDVVSLANGCVCCTIRDDLADTVMQTIDRPEHPEYVLLEASGVADPAGIAMTFNSPNLRDRIRTDSIVCVVDAGQVFAAPETMELKMFQMACADMIVLNKVDLAGREEIGRIRQWLDSRFHRYRLIEAIQCDVSPEILLSVGRFDPARGVVNCQDVERQRCSGPHCADERHGHDHAQAFGTWSYETDRPLSLEALREAASQLPADVYRAKGIVRAAETPERRAVLQVIGRRVDITLADEWGARTPRTQIVAIGARGALDGEVLRKIIDRCAVAKPSS